LTGFFGRREFLMGRGSREKPTKLGKKLAKLRAYLGLSQDGLVRALGLTAKLTRNDISKYERGLREPTLPVLLKYARAAGVSVEVLIDDNLELPLKRGEKGRRRG
jgi:transcriptional regulator with XRE-family HTH domain